MTTAHRRIVTGRLVFRQAGPPTGLGGFAWEAALPHGILSEEGIARGTTTPDGRFSVGMPVSETTLTMRLHLLDSARTYAADGTPCDTESVVRTLEVEVPPGDSDVGTHLVAWWPYRTDFPTPRAARVDGHLPEGYSKGFTEALALAFARVTPTKLLLEGENRLRAAGVSMATIQAHQPRTGTLQVEAETPGRTRSDAWLGDRLLNGFDVALQVGHDVEAPGMLRARITWGDMPATTAYDLTDVDVQLDPRGDEVVATRIIVRVRTPGEGGRWESDTTHTLTPADGARWEQAKRIVRSQYLLHGALDGHITRCHFQTETFAVAARRTLRRNPVRNVLLPHLKEIVAQGADGDQFAWGPDGILARQSALTVPAMHARMRRRTANWDWRGFQPRPVLHPTHRYAKAAALFWDVLGAYLEDAFRRDADAIARDWTEIRAFSDELVAHSLPYEGPIVDPYVHTDGSEEADPSAPRDVVAGAPRALSPITHSDTPQPGEMEALRDLCRYVIYEATFNHTWTHDGQYAAGGELAYATFGLRNGSFGDESDATVAPVPEHAIEALTTNTLGTLVNHGYLLADEEHDVPPALKAALAQHRAAFAALGVDVAALRSRVNI